MHKGRDTPTWRSTALTVDQTQNKLNRTLDSNFGSQSVWNSNTFWSSAIPTSLDSTVISSGISQKDLAQNLRKTSNFEPKFKDRKPVERLFKELYGLSQV